MGALNSDMLCAGAPAGESPLVPDPLTATETDAAMPTNLRGTTSSCSNFPGGSVHFRPFPLEKISPAPGNRILRDVRADLKNNLYRIWNRMSGHVLPASGPDGLRKRTEASAAWAYPLRRQPKRFPGHRKWSRSSTPIGVSPAEVGDRRTRRQPGSDAGVTRFGLRGFRQPRPLARHASGPEVHAVPVDSALWSLLRKACSAEFLPEAAGRARVSGRDAAFAG